MLIPLLLTASLLASPAPQEIEEKLSTLQLVLLRKGPKPDPTGSQASQMQAAHLANLANLHRKRVNLAYGPLESDDIAGIAILDVPSADAAKKAFAADPFVQAGVMTVEVHPVKASKEWFHAAATTELDRPAAKDLEPLVFGLFMKGPSEGNREATERLHEQYMEGLRGLRKVVAEGPIAGDPNLREYVIYRPADPDEAQTLGASDPAVKSGELTLRTHRWMTFKGIFR